MPLVDENRLKGNYAALYVAASLSTHCLVRPVASDTDIGIDLYCESVRGGQGFLHFWVQVKSGSQCKLARDGASASYLFRKRHLEYWGRQPVPVFAALVPVKWPLKQAPRIYIVPITAHLLFGNLPQGKAKTFSSTTTLNPGNQDDVRRFVDEMVREVTAQLECKKGLVTAVPELSPQYVRSFPPIPVTRFQEAILNQIRTTAAMSVLKLHSLDQLSGATSDFRRRLVRLVELFPDRGNYENSYAQALSCHADKDYNRAVEFYEEAKRRIENDPNVASLPQWMQLVGQIDNMKRLAAMRSPIMAGKQAVKGSRRSNVSPGHP